MQSQERENKIEKIKDNIKYLPDDIVSKLFNTMTQDKENIKVNTISSSYRGNKIKYIDKNLNQLDQNVLTTVETTIKTYLKEVGNKEKRKVHIAIVIANKILDLDGLTNIKDLCEFKDVHRDTLTSDKCKEIFDFYDDELFDNAFDRSECVTHKKKTIHPHISLYKNMLKAIGYNLSSRVRKYKTEDGKEKVYTTYYVSKND